MLMLINAESITLERPPNRLRKGYNNTASYINGPHHRASGHDFDFEEVNILDRENRWFEGGVKEAILVRAEEPSLNRCGGVCHNLSGAWDRIVRKTISRSLTSSSTSDDVIFRKL